MTRSAAERARDVRRVVEAARRVARERGRWIGPIAESTGLSPEGVELGFARHLELDPSEAEVASLVSAGGDAERITVVLSANVFVAPLRAIALARAASERVAVRPSRRDPWLARALVDAVEDPAITLVDEVAYEALSGEVQVYGRDETIAAIRARVPAGVRVRGHGAGLGIALVSAAAEVTAAAEGLAADVIPFDQRGCLSPRLAIVEGGEARARSFAEALDLALAREGALVPRGALEAKERADAAWWLATMAVAGHVIERATHAIAVAPAGSAFMVGPPGRHVHVATVPTLEGAEPLLADWRRAIVAVGADDPARIAPLVPQHARVSPLGAMQRPPLDGPVDARDPWGGAQG